MKTTKEKPCYAFCELTESDLLLEDYFFVPLILFLSDTYPKMLGKKNFAKEAITYALIQDRYWKHRALPLHRRGKRLRDGGGM